MRLDGSEELRSQLAERDHTIGAAPSSEELFLHAWKAWGEGALAQVLGDFSLALWDTNEQTLWCARDFVGARGPSLGNGPAAADERRSGDLLSRAGDGFPPPRETRDLPAREWCGASWGGVLFSGGAGYGKSTTAAALALRGVPVWTEDIVPLELTKDSIWAVPGYPRVCLWPDAAEKLAGEKEALPKLTPTWEKRFLPLDGVRARFSAGKKRLGVIYLLAVSADERSAPRIEEMRPREALLSLVQNTYMNWLLDRERRAEEFDALSKVVREVPVRRIATSSDGAKIGMMCELIQADVEQVLQKS